VEIRPDERLLLVGPSRSGKTTWALQKALPQLDRAVLLDTKGERGLAEFARRHRYVVANGEAEALRLIAGRKPPPRLLARCSDPLDDAANALLERVYAGPPTTVFVDEAMHWSTAQRIPRGMRLLLTAGGGRGIGVWACTQRLVEVSNFFIYAGDPQFIVFRVAPDEAQKLRHVPGIEQATILPPYCWLYTPAPTVRAVAFGPVPLRP
jgi:hypothetical protein